MLRTIILFCLLSGAKIFAEPYLYVKSLPAFGVGIKSSKAHFYLGLDWYGYVNKWSRYDTEENLKASYTRDNLIVSPTLGIRYDFVKNDVKPYIDGSATVSYNFAKKIKDISLSFLIGFGIAVKIAENIEISGEYSLKYNHYSYSEDVIFHYNDNDFVQAPSLSFAYFFTGKKKMIKSGN